MGIVSDTERSAATEWPHVTEQRKLPVRRTGSFLFFMGFFSIRPAGLEPAASCSGGTPPVRTSGETSGHCCWRMKPFQGKESKGQAGGKNQPEEAMLTSHLVVGRSARRRGLATRLIPSRKSEHCTNRFVRYTEVTSDRAQALVLRTLGYIGPTFFGNAPPAVSGSVPNGSSPLK